MADFGPEATQLSAPQAAGANPVEGVQTSSYTPNLAPIANFVSGMSDIFGKLKKDKAAESDQRSLSGLTEDLAQAEQEWEQTKDINRFAVRKGQIIRKWQVIAPHLSGEFKKILGVFQEGTTGRAEEARKVQQEFEKDALMEGYKNGIPNVPGNEKTTIDTVLTTRRIRAKQLELYETMKRDRDMEGWSKERDKEKLKEENGKLLTELSGKWLMSFGDNATLLAKRVKAGADPAGALGQLMGQYNTIMAQIDSLGTADNAMAEPYRRQFNQVLDTFKPYFSKDADSEGLENSWKKTQTIANMNYLGKDPQLMEMFTYSKAFSNQPSLYTTIHPHLQKKLASMGLKEAGVEASSVKGVSTQIVGNPDDEKQALGVVKSFVKNSLDGKMSGEDAKFARKEVYGQLKGMMKQYSNAYQLGELNADSRKKMNEFLLDPDVSRFIKENPLPVDVARGLAAAAEDNFKQFQRTFNSETKDLLLGVQIQKPRFDSFKGRGQGYQPGKRGESVNPVDAVNITWRNNSIVFEPVNMPVDRTDQNLLVSKLNSLQTVFTNGVRIAATIQGEDPSSFFEANKHRLFPEKFEAPVEKGLPKPTDKQDYSKESNLKAVVNSAPMNVDAPADYNIKSIREELKKTKDPAAREVLLDELEKQLRRRD